VTAIDLERRQQRSERIRNWLGLAILGGALAWAVVVVAVRSFGPGSDFSLTQDKKLIRLVHWQLEGGYVDGMNKAMRDYEKLHPDVVVQQIDIHERAYTQWVQTQLIGRTAPDLIELRFGGNLLVRYFVPITDMADRPNPYNNGTELEGLPWRETYLDGMMGGYQSELQDYYGIPTSCFTVRVYANKDILKKAANCTEPPRNLGEFLDVCQKIQDYAKANRLKLVPIAGSDYTAGIFEGTYQSAGMYPLIAKMDIDLDGGISDGERLLAEMGGKVDIETDPCWEATHKLQYELSRYYNPGFMSAKRDQAVFLFAQGNAAMIATGTWDAGSIWQQVEGDFEIMIFNFPVPTPGQKYYDIIKYRLSEAGYATQGLFGLSKFSRHPEIAIDFMQFLTSRKINEEVNAKWRWFPAIRGAKTDELLKNFEPHVDGVYGPFGDVGLNGGPDTVLGYKQRHMAFISTIPPENVDFDKWLDQHYKKFVHSVKENFTQYYFSDFETYWRNSTRPASRRRRPSRRPAPRRCARG